MKYKVIQLLEQRLTLLLNITDLQVWKGTMQVYLIPTAMGIDTISEQLKEDSYYVFYITVFIGLASMILKQLK